MQLHLTRKSYARQDHSGRWGVDTSQLEAILSLSTYNFKFCDASSQEKEELTEDQHLHCTDDFLFVIGTETDFVEFCNTSMKSHSHDRIHLDLEQESSTPKSRIKGRPCSNGHSYGNVKYYRPQHLIGRSYAPHNTKS